MAGLESIALAVAHLEESGETGTSNMPTVTTGTYQHRDNYHYQVACHSNNPALSYPTGARHFSSMPNPTKFSAAAPRVVSHDAPTLMAQLAPHKTEASRLYMIAATPSKDEDGTARPEDRRSPVTDAEASLSSLDSVLGLDVPSGTTEQPPATNEVITRVQKNDVLCGRGGETNHHAGNIQYRHFVKSCQQAYIAAKRRDKPKIAEKIVAAVRKLGGRFLKKHVDNSWRDVGNVRAREKTSQALREGAPDLRSTSTGTTNSHELQHHKSTDVPVTSLPKYEHYRPPHYVLPHVVETSMSGYLQLDRDNAEAIKKRRVDVHNHVPASVVSPANSDNMGYGSALQAPVVPEPPPPPLISQVSSSQIDDDASKASSGNEQSVVSRGPRIKLLKRRLERNDGGSG